MNKSIRIILNRTPKGHTGMQFDSEIQDQYNHDVNIDAMLTRMNEEISERKE